ncbi:hypothetical protein [uncultured Veillonella sp.]|uniref:hypothetical protein n=1 Tax=uncultured Veillonella sp. TaxID=159268 RepID=UPI0028EB4809|nr:hypothetical protein [uncultured Veillonella sp.]
MKRCITLLSLGLCLAAPMLSQGMEIKPLIHVTNVHNGQYDEALDAITDTKFYGPYQFHVLKDAVETKGETKDIDGRVFRTSDGVFMHVKARSIDSTSPTLDAEVNQFIKERTVPEPTVKMILPVKHDVIEVNNDGVRSLLVEFMYGWPLNYRTDMVLISDYEDTRYYYNLQFYRQKLPEGVRVEQLRQMITDAYFSYK